MVDSDATYIDQYSEYSLYDVVNGSLPLGESTEYEGLHLMSQGESVSVQPDGHIGSVDRIDPEEIDDVLELVDRLNRHVSLWWELAEYGDDEDLVDWAGKIMTHSKERADGDDTRVHVPPREDVDDIDWSGVEGAMDVEADSES